MPRFVLAPASPSGLVWGESVYCGKNHNRLLFKPGDVAGGKNREGYWYVSAEDGYRTLAHLVVWALAHGKIGEGFVIDHKDGNPSNNALSNLRKVTHAVNLRNQVNRVPEGPVLGVTKTAIQRANGKVSIYWQAKWVEPNGKQVGRMFNINKYGEEGAKLKAIEIRQLAIHNMNKDGAGYTPVHQ